MAMHELDNFDNSKKSCACAAESADGIYCTISVIGKEMFKISAHLYFGHLTVVANYIFSVPQHFHVNTDFIHCDFLCFQVELYGENWV